MKSVFQRPKGTNDLFYPEINYWHHVEEMIRQHTREYGYTEIRTPLFEHLPVFKRPGDSSDVVQKEMYSFLMNKTMLCLRPEQTASVARAYSEHHFEHLMKHPLRLYYCGAQFRHERPQKGRQRIFHQFGVEVFAELDAYQDAEVILMGLSFLQKLGLRGYRLVLNSLGDSECRQRYQEALREYLQGYLEVLCLDCQRRYHQNVLRVLDCKVDQEHAFLQGLPVITDYLSEVSQSYFQELLRVLKVLGVPFEVNPRLVRGLDYYQELVFEVISDEGELGAQSTIFGGGRYGGLTSHFGGTPTTAIGWAMGMERLIILFRAANPHFVTSYHLDVYVVTVGAIAPEAVLQLMSELREHQLNALTTYHPTSFKGHFKQVAYYQPQFVVIMGAEDWAQQRVTVKKMATGEQEQVAREQLVAYLQAIKESGSA